LEPGPNRRWRAGTVVVDADGSVVVADGSVVVADGSVVVAAGVPVVLVAVGSAAVGPLADARDAPGPPELASETTATPVPVPRIRAKPAAVLVMRDRREERRPLGPLGSSGSWWAGGGGGAGVNG
jgi:hypothetical protein